MDIISLAKEIATRLGHSFHARGNYQFAVPNDGHVTEKSVEAAVFSSPVPSIQTASIGFKKIHLEQIQDSDLSDIAYLGAKVLFVGYNNRTVVYEYSGSPVPQKVDEIQESPSQSESWIREKATRAVESSQISLGIESGRQILLEATRIALSKQVGALMSAATKGGANDDLEAFRIAMAVIRRAFFVPSTLRSISPKMKDIVSRLASSVRSTVSFANIPPESIAELYESLAVGTDQRRRKGVVYTPSWLARYVVNRLPIEAFLEGNAVDPTCGSGTFMVCFLERVVEERARRGLKTNAKSLVSAVKGIDQDPVAIETARLTLDFFATRIGFGDALDWNLQVKDATKNAIAGDWVIGNLPFGYRTHEGRSDISAIILQKLEDDSKRKGISLILPDSIAYTGTANEVRRLLRSNYRIQEITRLPEEVFENSSAKTIVLTALRGASTDELVVREVRPKDLSSLKRGRSVARSYTSRFSQELTDPWRFTPFSNEMMMAERRGVLLGSMSKIWMGLQIYGKEGKALSRDKQEGEGARLLADPDVFASWNKRAIKKLPVLTASKKKVRRPGPWDLNRESKVIVRTTTTPCSFGRLSAIPDEQGIWFTDKFAGLWPCKPEEFGINAIASYLQTRFARVWFDTSNPSRKLRISTLELMPVPILPSEWWSRASLLAGSDSVVRPPQLKDETELFTNESAQNNSEWEWFNSVVEAAFSFPISVGSSMSEWLTEQERNLRADD